ncbi:MAG: hypothetical protein KGI40_12630 [Xanthomonadaceae bacterium]|nr:hypothetical protein [Xanthomonadaceae bacterium]MDE1959910.1 hypothetical protein [Xanthomonadaceae bacterium]MDE2179122.1 hypothetical protein [Xanthomonadaceae bacterium]
MFVILSPQGEGSFLRSGKLKQQLPLTYGECSHLSRVVIFGVAILNVVKDLTAETLEHPLVCGVRLTSPLRASWPSPHRREGMLAPRH